MNEDGTSFTVTLTEGEWYISAEGKNEAGDIVLSGLVTVNVSETGSMTDADGNSLTGEISIPLSVPSNSALTGTVSLAITDLTGLIKTVTVYEITENGRGDVFATADFTEGTATVRNEEKLSAGVYMVELVFDDEAGNTLYSCREAVTVIGGLTTDIWYGTSPYINGGKLVLTDAVLAAYASDVVPNTKTVLYNAYEENSVGAASESGYKYYLVDEAGAEIIGNTAATATTTGGTNSFAFDSEGNFYAIQSVGSTTSQTVIYSNKAGFGTNNDNTVTISDVSLSAIAIDRKTNILYGFKGIYLYAYPNLISEGNTSYFKKYGLPTGSVGTISISDNSGISVFVVYDNVLYIPFPDITASATNNNEAETIYLLMQKISDDTTTSLNAVDYSSLMIALDNIIDLGLSDMGFSANMAVTDMLYQDGAVYLLVRERNYSEEQAWSSGEPLYSRGAVVKYDTFFGTTSILGWTEQKITYSADSPFGIYGYISDDSNNTPIYSHLFTDEDLSKKLVVDGSKRLNSAVEYCSSNFPTVYSAEVDSATSLFGPSKFIAVKPKRLVIADDGIAFYVNEDGALSFKNKNRVVYVDLESFAIAESETVTSGAGFDGDPKLLLTASGFVDSSDGSCYLNEADNKPYWKMPSDSASTYSGNFYGGIPLGE